MDTAASSPGKRRRREITADTSGSDLRPNLNDAFGYLADVKQKLDPDKYQNFLKIMMDMHTKSIRPIECVKMVKDLLEGHTDLLSGFLNFVPEDLDKIDQSLSENKKKARFKDLTALVCKVKRHFADNDEKYKLFVNILFMEPTDGKSFDKSCQKAILLIQDRADLIQELKQFHT